MRIESFLIAVSGIYTHAVIRSRSVASFRAYILYTYICSVQSQWQARGAIREMLREICRALMPIDFSGMRSGRRYVYREGGRERERERERLHSGGRGNSKTYLIERPLRLRGHGGGKSIEVN